MSSQDMHSLVEPQLQFRIEQFFYREAEILDERRFRDWLEFFAEDARYWMPIRSVRPPRERKYELSAPDELATFDESKPDLEQRIRKLETGRAWAEEPPSRTRHCVSNVRLKQSGSGIESRCNFIVFQGRAERDEHWFVGERHDSLRFAASGPLGFQIVSRKIVVDHATLLAPSVSIFF